MFDLTPATRLVTTTVGSVTEEDLQRPTPCPEMTVEVLLGHLHGLALAFGDAARKVEGPMADSAPKPAASQLPEDWRSSIPSALGALADAWSNPDAWVGMTKVGGQQMPGDVAAAVTLDEVVLHGWDLAVATGQPYPIDEDSVATVEAFCSEVPDDPAARGGLFGPRLPVPEDAPQWHRALALSGRDPHWQAPAAD